MRISDWSSDVCSSDLPDAFPFVRFRGPVAIVGLSSAQPTPLFCAHGTLGTAQLDRLAGMLRRLGAAGHFRVVLLHHPPGPAKLAWGQRLDDAEGCRGGTARGGRDLNQQANAQTPQQ